jgi:hypothetical protein
MRRTVVTAALGAAAVLVVTAGTASAAFAHPASRDYTPRPGTVAYETDNGTAWTLADHAGTGGVRSTGSEAGYADAGVVVYLGQAADFTGVHVTGSLNLAENIWVTDGSEATVPGSHPLSADVNFDYGLGGPDGWYMVGKKDAYNGQTLTAAQIRTDFAGYQIWAWAGIDDSGTTSYGYVTSVNGYQADAILGLEAQGANVTAYALPFLLGYGQPT